MATPSLKELEGLPSLEETIAKVRGMYKPDLYLSAVIPCIVPPASAGALYVEGQERLREAYGDLVTPPVRRSVRVPEAYSQRVPLTVHAPLEQITSDYQAVADYLKGRRSCRDGHPTALLHSGIGDAPEARVCATVRGIARVTNTDYTLSRLVEDALDAYCASMEEQYHGGAPGRLRPSTATRARAAG